MDTHTQERRINYEELLGGKQLTKAGITDKIQYERNKEK